MFFVVENRRELQKRSPSVPSRQKVELRRVGLVMTEIPVLLRSDSPPAPPIEPVTSWKSSEICDPRVVVGEDPLRLVFAGVRNGRQGPPPPSTVLAEAT